MGPSGRTSDGDMSYVPHLLTGSRVGLGFSLGRSMPFRALRLASSAGSKLVTNLTKSMSAASALPMKTRDDLERQDERVSLLDDGGGGCKCGDQDGAGAGCLSYVHSCAMNAIGGRPCTHGKHATNNANI
ncbi:hypothetical protein BC830DRAFT_1172146 [Chytriomyces sp. MP71]|nr:hypothetical protein BC830DRAFT_1172146 [Chytriomyces sp. MP71]